jgi:hypothetical protein
LAFGHFNRLVHKKHSSPKSAPHPLRRQYTYCVRIWLKHSITVLASTGAPTIHHYSRPVTSAGRLSFPSRSRNGRETGQPYELPQRPMAATRPAAEYQDPARESRLRMDVDCGEIDQLHLSAAAAIDV